MNPQNNIIKTGFQLFVLLSNSDEWHLMCLNIIPSFDFGKLLKFLYKCNFSPNGYSKTQNNFLRCHSSEFDSKTDKWKPVLIILFWGFMVIMSHLLVTCLKRGLFIGIYTVS